MTRAGAPKQPDIGGGSCLHGGPKLHLADPAGDEVDQDGDVPELASHEPYGRIAAGLFDDLADQRLQLPGRDGVVDGDA